MWDVPPMLENTWRLGESSCNFFHKADCALRNREDGVFRATSRYLVHRCFIIQTCVDSAVWCHAAEAFRFSSVMLPGRCREAARLCSSFFLCVMKERNKESLAFWHSYVKYMNIFCHGLITTVHSLHIDTFPRAIRPTLILRPLQNENDSRADIWFIWPNPHDSWGITGWPTMDHYVCFLLLFLARRVNSSFGVSVGITAEALGWWRHPKGILTEAGLHSNN